MCVYVCVCLFVTLVNEIETLGSLVFSNCVSSNFVTPHFFAMPLYSE